MIVTEFKIVIEEFGNQRMVDFGPDEVRRMLLDLADRVPDYGLPNMDGTVLKDLNGNTVGRVTVLWEEDDEEDEETE